MHRAERPAESGTVAARRRHSVSAHLSTMSVKTVSVFFALLALAANAGTIAIALGRVTGRWQLVRDLAGPSALWIAAGVTGVATLGSLYYSEVVGFPPCELCWYQRIAMYPLPLILGIAAWRRDAGVRRYGVPVAVVGALIAAYHYQLEWFPSQATVCTSEIPCSVAWFREFGFISLPYMALSGFLFAIALMLAATFPRAGDRPPTPAALQKASR
jgi:disulfide bond formation protein DsbB